MTVAGEPTLKTAKSQELLERARRVAPGGIQGDGRWSEPFPLFIERALGARLWDVDGNEYIDLWSSAGPSILGHNDPRVRSAVMEVMETEGVLFTAPHRREVELAEVLSEVIPCAEKTALCGGGGSDAMYNAVRVARAYTGKRKILKFEGGYHGWHDYVAASAKPDPRHAGPADAPNTVPISAGSLRDALDQIVVAPFNDDDAVQRIIEREKADLAAVIIEPVCHSSGCLHIRPDFLRLLRHLCDEHSIVLVFDEVLTGFRHHVGGVQALYGITPDLGVFGKAMANGYTISALAGKEDIMSLFMPQGPVFLSGTFMANLLGVTASLATIDLLRDGTVHKQLWEYGDRFRLALNSQIEDLGIAARCYAFGGFWTLYFTRTEITNYRDIVATDTREKDQALRQWLRNRGMFVSGANRPVRAMFSAAHSDNDVDRVIAAISDFLTDHRTMLR